MAEIKGKVLLCRSSINDFNVEQINASPFYKRYSEFVSVLRKHLPDVNAEVLFAQPVENSAKGTIDWYIPTPSESPCALESYRVHDPEAYERLSARRSTMVARLQKALADCKDEEEQKYLSCAMRYLDCDYSDKVVYSADDEITFAVWGMGVRKGRVLETVITDDAKEHRIHTVNFVIEGEGDLIGKTEIARAHGYELQGKSDVPEVKPAENCVFVEWRPEPPQGKPVVADITYIAVCRREAYEVKFESSEGGHVVGETSVLVPVGSALTLTSLPRVECDEGFKFVGWEPEITFDTPVEQDAEYVALFRPEEKTPPAPPVYSVEFRSDEGGGLVGTTKINVPLGGFIPSEAVPVPRANRGFEFAGWSGNLGVPIQGDAVFTARFAKKKAWWQQSWLRWLLGLLLLLALLLGLLFFLRGCVGCSGLPFLGGETNGVVAIDSIEGANGNMLDDNGRIKPITGQDGRLPDDVDGIVAPIVSEDGSQVPIEEQPGAPDIISNRLFLFMEEDNGDIDGLATAFKQAYPEDDCAIIGFDRDVKLLVVQVPEGKRDEMRRELNAQIPQHRFIVFDEQIYEIQSAGLRNTSDAKPGWHLGAIGASDGWAVTKGSRDVKVAIVDDGIEASHPFFEGRIVDAYNVFTQDNHLSTGQGHGTHTAGIAAGNDSFLAQGAAGVAPKCSLMPIQVFDNGRCPLSALVAGVMYALHHGADVVNVSVGPSFEGLNALPVATQNEIAHNRFKNLEVLWNRVCRIAAQKNSILVFAAGNDDILSSIPPENRNSSCIVVASVDERKYPTAFTNYGPCSDISAPGLAIYSSVPHGSFASQDGTSMSAPIVAGAVALMKSLKKDLTVEQARNVLYRTGVDVYGYLPPMVHLGRALQAVKQGDFSSGNPRALTPVPEADITDIESGGVLVPSDPRAYDLPAVGDVVVVGPGNRVGTDRDIVAPGNDVITGGNEGVPVDGGTGTGSKDEAVGGTRTDDKSPTSVAKQPVGDDTDYDAIRRLIKDYENRISNLKKQLPEYKK